MRRKRPAKTPPPAILPVLTRRMPPRRNLRRPTKAPPPATVPEVIEATKPLSSMASGEVLTTAARAPNGRGRPARTVSLEAPEDVRPSYRFLRFSAGLAYSTDLNGVSISELADRPPFKGVVSYDALMKWSQEDQWVARREVLAQEWRRSVELKMGQRTVQQALVDLDNTDRWTKDAMDKLDNKIGKVNSYEGLVNATVRLMEFRANLRSQVMASVAPTMGTPGMAGSAFGNQMPKPKLNVEDAKAAAEAIIKRRRDEIRAEQAQAKAAIAAPEAAPTKLLPEPKP